MAFPSQFLDEIRARVRLSDIVGRTVKLARRGQEHMGLCPFHNEKTPSFTVSDDKNFYHCFGCGAHGDVIGYVMNVDGLTFPEAVERMSAEAGLEVPVSTPAEREQEKRRAGLIDVMNSASAHFEHTLWSPDGHPALKYLRERGLRDETIRNFRLGFAPPGNTLKTALLSNEIPEAALFEGGLVRKSEEYKNTYDFFRSRVIFPISDGRGRVIAFGGRSQGDGEPKYLNSPDTPLFDKRRTLYGFDRARRAAHQKGRVIVTEGYMDVITLAQAGFVETVAPLGTALTESHIMQLWTLCDEPVLCFDGDRAGLGAATRTAARVLPLLVPDKSFRFITLPAGEDPDSIVSAQGPGALESLIETASSLSTMVWSMETTGRAIDTPERIAGLEKRLEDHALSIADRNVQYRYRSLFRENLRLFSRNTRNISRNTQNHEIFRRDKSAREAWREDTGVAGFSHLRSGPEILKKRLEQVLLATILNHPVLLNTFAEDIAMMNVSDPMLDKLRQEILKVHAQAEKLDPDQLKNQLEIQGNIEILQSVLGPEVYVHAAFAREGSTEENVLSGFMEVLNRLLEPVRRAELEEARQYYINDPTDANWERFEKLKTDSPDRQAIQRGTEETTAPAD
ncbi:MAG: DNA primase [Pseudomonadota bacterium]|nr:DNA primase [Pseudomonadota bacterium]